MLSRWLLPLVLPLASAMRPAVAAPSLIAGEAVYGDIAGQIGAPPASVTSLLTNPDQDPHLFEASPSTARAVAAADIVVVNGLGYDLWLPRLLAAAPREGRVVIDVGALAGRHDGDNPHLWNDLPLMAVFAASVAHALATADEADAELYQRRLRRVDETLEQLDARVASLRARFGGTAVAATESVLGPLLDRLGLVSRGQVLQRAVMNDAEPPPSAIAEMEDDLRRHRVRALVVNTQATNRIADRMRAVAEAAGVPIVPVMETAQAGVPYQTWIAGELDGLERALAR